MVPVDVMCSLGKVAIQGDQPLCLGVMMVSIETCPKAVGSEAYSTRQKILSIPLELRAV